MSGWEVQNQAAAKLLAEFQDAYDTEKGKIRREMILKAWSTVARALPDIISEAATTPSPAALSGSSTAPLPAHTRLILASENLLEQWGTRTERGERITAEWGEPKPEGWFEPTFTVHSDDVLGSSTAPLDVERLTRALRDWEARRHPVPSPDDDDGPHVWDAWIAEARKLAAAASPDPAQPDRAP